MSQPIYAGNVPFNQFWRKNHNIKTYTIYMVTCSITRKKYIGQTSNFSTRKQSHLNGSTDSSHLLREDVCTFGTEYFDIVVLDKAFSLEDAKRKECEYIVKHKTLFPKGYNLSFSLKGYHQQYLTTNHQPNIYKCPISYLVGVDVFNSELKFLQRRRRSTKIINRTFNRILSKCINRTNKISNMHNHPLQHLATDLNTLFYLYKQQNDTLTLSSYLDIIEAVDCLDEIKV